MFFGRKYFIFVALLATVTAQSQNTELVDYLLAIQDATANYYRLMDDIISDTRILKVQGMAALNNVAVNNIAEALKAIVEIRDELDPVINDATSVEQCVQTTVSNWRTVLNSSGSTIASCVQVNETRAIVDVINKELNEQSVFIFEIQNLILSSLSEINIVTNQQGLTPFINNESLRIVQTFIGYTAIRFGRLLEDADTISRNQLMEFQACVADTVARVRDEAIVVANTLEFC